MDQNSVAPANKRNIWMRGLFMLLMIFAFQVSWAVLCIVTAVQFVLALLNGTPNARLASLGRSLGRYFEQIIIFLAFATEELPFPFSDWPSGN